MSDYLIPGLVSVESLSVKCLRDEDEFVDYEIKKGSRGARGINRDLEFTEQFLSDMKDKEVRPLNYLKLEDDVDVALFAEAAKHCGNELEILRLNLAGACSALILEDEDKIAGFTGVDVYYQPGKTEVIRQYGVLKYEWGSLDQKLVDLLLNMGTS